MTPTTDELRALAERLERPDFWRLFQGIGADDGLPERFDDAPKEAAAALRQWIAEREQNAVIADFIASQEPLDAEMAAILANNIEELYEK